MSIPDPIKYPLRETATDEMGGLWRFDFFSWIYRGKRVDGLPDLATILSQIFI